MEEFGQWPTWRRHAIAPEVQIRERR